MSGPISKENDLCSVDFTSNKLGTFKWGRFDHFLYVDQFGDVLTWDRFDLHSILGYVPYSMRR